MSDHPEDRAARQLTPDAASQEVATGDRRADVRYERRADQQLRVRASFPPDGPMPPEMVPAPDAPPPPAAQPDVAALPDVPSAWDARPPEDEGSGGGSEPAA